MTAKIQEIAHSFDDKISHLAHKKKDKSLFSITESVWKKTHSKDVFLDVLAKVAFLACAIFPLILILCDLTVGIALRKFRNREIEIYNKTVDKMWKYVRYGAYGLGVVAFAAVALAGIIGFKARDIVDSSNEGSSLQHPLQPPSLLGKILVGGSAVLGTVVCGGIYLIKRLATANTWQGYVQGLSEKKRNNLIMQIITCLMRNSKKWNFNNKISNENLDWTEVVESGTRDSLTDLFVPAQDLNSLEDGAQKGWIESFQSLLIRDDKTNEDIQDFLRENLASRRQWQLLLLEILKVLPSSLNDNAKRSVIHCLRCCYEEEKQRQRGNGFLSKISEAIQKAGITEDEISKPIQLK